MADAKTGEEAEATELGAVANLLLETFEKLDLPEAIQGARLIVMLDTDKEGVIAASENHDDPKDVVAAGFSHLKALLELGGMDMQVIGEDEMRRMMGLGQN